MDQIAKTIETVGLRWAEAYEYEVWYNNTIAPLMAVLIIAALFASAAGVISLVMYLSHKWFD